MRLEHVTVRHISQAGGSFLPAGTFTRKSRAKFMQSGDSFLEIYVIIMCGEKWGDWYRKHSVWIYKRILGRTQPP